jgi:hypothetical protein
MIQHTIRPHAPLAPHTCGSTPHLVESRGHSGTDPRLLGTRGRSYHVECSRCAIATAPQLSARTAEHLWDTATRLVPVDRLPALRLKAERALINAA